MKKWLTMISLAATMLAVSACGDESAEGENGEGAENGESQTAEEGQASEGAEGGQSAEGGETPEMPEPDLEDVPDVVAEINGEEITKGEFEQVYTGQFQQASMMQEMTGEEVNEDELKQQIADGLVSERLLIQEAENRDISASEEDVDAMISEITEANGMESEEDFFAAMEESGMSEDEIRAELEKQVKVEALIAEEAGDIEPTDEELQEVYDEQIAQREEAQSEGEGEGEETEPPAFEDVKPQIEEQLVREKEAEAAQGLAEELREDADVTVNL
ncbi:MAG TPA: SurA N-terminal domain-containing protein [Candidatus Salinicoccus merdavium]|nr:SurA N-terminal domain-containing protein [Candidatus Salinicoccus merdavium]